MNQEERPWQQRMKGNKPAAPGFGRVEVAKDVRGRDIEGDEKRPVMVYCADCKDGIVIRTDQERPTLNECQTCGSKNVRYIEAEAEEVEA